MQKLNKRNLLYGLLKYKKLTLGDIMKFLAILTITMLSGNLIASSETLLRLKREKPILDCEISQKSVKITRSAQGVSFSKNTSYQMEDLSPFIKAAYENRNGSSETPSEHTAFLIVGNEKINFNLDANEPKALKVIRLISTLCEVRNL